MKEIKTNSALEALEVTQNLLCEICVPVRHNEIIDKIVSAIRNLEIIKSMIVQEKEELTNNSDVQETQTESD